MKRVKPPLVIKISKIHGLGLFATKKIHWGTKVIQYKGKIINLKESVKRQRIYDKQGITYIFNLDKKRDIDGGVGENMAKYVNHSCHPNLGCLRTQSQIWFYSLNDIKRGEELTIDYDFDDESTRCQCKSKCCRGFI